MKHPVVDRCPRIRVEMKYVINQSLIYDPSCDEIISLCTFIHIYWLEI